MSPPKIMLIRMPEREHIRVAGRVHLVFFIPMAKKYTDIV